MRKVLVLLVALFILGNVVPAGAAGDTSVKTEWNWIEEAGTLKAQGDLSGAMALWAKIVDSAKTHNYDLCGNYAQQLGRALADQGRYPEAVAAFEDEFYCWGQFSDRQEWVLWDQRRAEQIRPALQLFVQRSTQGEPSGQLAKFEPPFGTMLGGPIDKDTAINEDLTKVPVVYGKQYAMVLVYARWGEFPDTIAVAQAKSQNRALQVAWEPSTGLDAVKNDDYMQAFAAKLKAFGLPVFLRFAGEMDGDWVPWHGDPAKYREKFALVAQTMRQAAPNVAMVWSPNYTLDDATANYYPGDQWVDWVGASVYHEAYFQGNPSTLQRDADIFHEGKRSNPLDKLRYIYDHYAAKKPIMISESGFSWATRNPYQEEVQWAAGALDEFYGYAPLLYPRLKAISYFNVDVMANPGVPTGGHYLLSAKPEMKQAFRQSTASGWYLDSPNASAAGFWRPAEKASLLGPIHFASYAHLGAGVSRVEYYLDGRLVAQPAKLPWEADLDLSGLQGEHTITLKAYDPNGGLGYQRDYAFDASAVRVNLNGRYLDFDQPPVIVDGRVLVPARVILEALGAEIAWEPDTETVVARKSGSTLRLRIGDPVPTRDGAPVKPLDVPAQIIGGRTLVPARFVAENYSMNVAWEPDTRTVRITAQP